MAEDTQYVVIHDGVGEYRNGAIAQFDKDVNVERLLGMGAIREATPDDLVEGDPILDVLRSESPPTLPAQGMPKRTKRVAGEVSDQPKAGDTGDQPAPATPPATPPADTLGASGDSVVNVGSDPAQTITAPDPATKTTIIIP